MANMSDKKFKNMEDILEEITKFITECNTNYLHITEIDGVIINDNEALINWFTNQFKYICEMTSSNKIASSSMNFHAKLEQDELPPALNKKPFTLYNESTYAIIKIKTSFYNLETNPFCKVKIIIKHGNTKFKKWVDVYLYK